MFLGPRMNIILRLKELLKEMIDPDHLLTDKLLSEAVLSNSERQDVESRRTLDERNEALLTVVVGKDESARLRFIKSLRDTDQEHVCNFIRYDGGRPTKHITLRIR